MSPADKQYSVRLMETEDRDDVLRLQTLEQSRNNPTNQPFDRLLSWFGLAWALRWVFWQGIRKKLTHATFGFVAIHETTGAIIGSLFVWDVMLTQREAVRMLENGKTDGLMAPLLLGNKARSMKLLSGLQRGQLLDFEVSVSEQFQGLGVYRALFERATEAAAAQGYKGMLFVANHPAVSKVTGGEVIGRLHLHPLTVFGCWKPWPKTAIWQLIYSRL
ncbi:unnamed protein product [Polarella glacialis]|uniref:N-acetyltransferase domain-containing protein n=1 Tax=Polarella glacialis TaxID=89957 RepID=A0A813H2H4_POLGL|nr:unnamed protein product [Polarella glacialis]